MEASSKLSLIDKITPVRLLIALSLVSVFCLLGTWYLGMNFILMAIIVVIGIPFSIAIVVYPKFGVLVLLVSAYLIMWVMRFNFDFPLGTLMDGLELLLIIGFFIHQKIHRDWAILKNPITFMILIWIGYNILQAFNPVAESKLAWLYTIRSVAIVMLTYFIFMVQIKSVAFIRLIFKVWIGLSLFAALYAFKQEYFGFFAFEERSLDSPLMRELLFIGGHWRKFSIFSDPVAFSYNMVVSAILCLVLVLSVKKTYKKAILIFLVGFFLLNMLYSGTRGANPLFPAAVFMLAILKFNYKVLGFSLLGLVFLVFLIFMPSSNQNILRFQSAFRPSDDASFNVRKINQKRIQPFIQQHPFGGGLGATGTWGVRFAPNSYLAHFPPDSGYVRVAVELGYVGLFIFCTLIFIILRTGIRNYFTIKDPELKNYCLAMVLIVFALGIGNYPQEALVQFPVSVYFYLIVALINITLILDKQKEKSKLLAENSNGIH
ncbi:O-antigen ligase family protein [Pedobacter frigoris]|uniref:O-antigen ligase domain-containing protein n=1 Tax=Pedobacter frigoris TaxID=2571272 RepID=A0A4U1CPA8_9SPHI|nr:O-antigen ligase family protein [Pedobacter frigoris]TKC09323.1 O-antigen ligase domain-containing protein [Pedobacter frigoris]